MAHKRKRIDADLTEGRYGNRSWKVKEQIQIVDVTPEPRQSFSYHLPDFELC